jgi:hypothetical protein
VENVYRLENKRRVLEKTSGNQSVGDDASGRVYRIFQSILLRCKAVRIMQYGLETNLIYAMLSMAQLLTRSLLATEHV